MSDVNALLREAALDGCVTCEECGNSIEPDCEACYCGWENPILMVGLI